MPPPPSPCPLLPTPPAAAPLFQDKAWRSRSHDTLAFDAPGCKDPSAPEPESDKAHVAVNVGFVGFCLFFSRSASTSFLSLSSSLFRCCLCCRCLDASLPMMSPIRWVSVETPVPSQAERESYDRRHRSSGVYSSSHSDTSNRKWPGAGIQNPPIVMVTLRSIVACSACCVCVCQLYAHIKPRGL